MKLLTLTWGIFLTTAAAAYGQGGAITLSSDPAGTSCNLADRNAGLCSIYVVHIEGSGVTGAQFSARAPACFTATWLSDTAVFPVILGDSQSGVSVAYGGCMSSPVHILTITFLCQGLTAECCPYRVLPHPGSTSGEIEVSDCNFTVLYAAGGRAVINGNPGCPCGYGAEASTWGKVKTLYRE